MGAGLAEEGIQTAPPPHEPGRLRVFVAGEGRFTAHHLPDSGRVTIGRDPSCELHVDDPSVAPRHAVLSMGPPVRIEDLGSGLPTSIRQDRVEPGKRQLNDANALNILVRRDLGYGGRRRQCIEIQHADGCSAGGGSADRHLRDIDAMIAKDGPHGADDPRHVVVRENEKVAIQVGFQAEIPQANEPRHVVAEERPAGN